MWTNAKELEKNKNYKDAPETYRTRSNGWSHTTGMCFVSMYSTGLSRDFHSILKQVTIYLYAANHPSMALISMML